VNGWRQQPDEASPEWTDRNHPHGSEPIYALLESCDRSGRADYLAQVNPREPDFPQPLAANVES
jgi:hypothetical protein